MLSVHHWARKRAVSKSQSAMEYLMTYGWAILIIAVVLGALYYLGVFNTANLAPRAQPGSCKVVRPNGPGTTTFINLAGICNGQLPQFVANFDGVSSNVVVGNVPNLNIINSITVSMWGKSSITTDSYWATRGRYNSKGWSIYQQTGRWTPAITTTSNTYIITGTSGTMVVNTWYHFVLVYDGANFCVYANGAAYSTCKSASGTIDYGSYTDTVIGYGGSSYYFNGQITNVQIYNTSLSLSEIQGLYTEGIGGAPTRLQNLVGWWPLNGNPNDYSGNGNNGAAIGVLFTSTWTK